ncbi:MAG: adenylate/guanylate cyclase domain-containing protein, partial [Alphaproteobacteria bacterium]|nr:adenylate/guanylate cyclase domain-containing protein [Alphaproteobacteria bacterium]
MADGTAPGTISGWLEGLGLGQHAETFETQEIYLDALPDVTEGDLKEMGIPIGPRRKILRAIGELGTPAEQPVRPQEAERRQITVMFCDLVGSTALSEKLAPEDLRSLMQRYQKACGAVIERYEGHVAQYLGDGLMTYFGWPRAHEDDAERAVRASLEIVEAVNAMDLQVRIGIATGPVVVGDIGAGDASVPKMAVGETPNLAARIQGLAGPDEVVIGPTTQRLVCNTFTADDLGEHQLKGVSDSVTLYRVVGESGAHSRFAATHDVGLTPLVGREAELALLLDRWHLAKDGEGQVVLLEGEAGIGKSRITEALRLRLTDQPHNWLRYQGSPYHTNSAFFPIATQLELAAGFGRDDDPAARLDKLQTLICEEPAWPLFAAMLSLPTDRYPSLNLEPVKQKEETISAHAKEIEALARQEPVLMICEDAHWYDPTTLEALEAIIQRVVRAPVLVVITFRPEFES